MESNTDNTEKPNKTTFDLDKAGKIFIYGSSILCIGMIFVAGSAISFAMLSAALGTASVMYFMFQLRTAGRGGKKVWNWCMNHSLIVDILMGVIFGYTFGITTATGVLAAGAAGVMNSAIMNLISDYTPNGGLVDIPPKPVKGTVVKTKDASYGNDVAIEAEFNELKVS